MSAALPRATVWTPNRNEIHGGVKQLVTHMIETLGSWDAGSSGLAEARRRLVALGHSGALADQFPGSLFTGARQAVAEVIDAQYGGILATSASVLVPMRQWLLDESGRRTQHGWTFDVRLTAPSASTPDRDWSVTEVHPSDPGAAASGLGALARTVLGSARIDLPPASRADIESGQVHDSVLRAMLQLSETWRIGVSVVRSGHPTYVFGTQRLSDHPRGRAFDTWSIDGHPVVAAATPKSLVTRYMNAAGDAGSYNVGGPYLLARTGYFSDNTHHDHVHAGFTS